MEGIQELFTYKHRLNKYTTTKPKFKSNAKLYLEILLDS